MRRTIVCALAALSLGCGGDSLLGPVTTCDGSWSGTQNGYNMGLGLTQAGSAVSGVVQIAGNLNAFQGTVSGSCSAPNVNLTLSIPGFDAVTYTGTFSQTSATIQGKLNGSAFVNLELDVTKR